MRARNAKRSPKTQRRRPSPKTQPRATKETHSPSSKDELGNYGFPKFDIPKLNTPPFDFPTTPTLAAAVTTVLAIAALAVANRTRSNATVPATDPATPQPTPQPTPQSADQPAGQPAAHPPAGNPLSFEAEIQTDDEPAEEKVARAEMEMQTDAESVSENAGSAETGSQTDEDHSQNDDAHAIADMKKTIVKNCQKFIENTNAHKFHPWRWFDVADNFRK